MNNYRLSQKAEEDIENILSYTLETWSMRQASIYQQGLEDCLTMLAVKPELGRDASFISPNTRRFPYQSHIVFYTIKEKNIYILRILHQSMDYKRHF